MNKIQIQCLICLALLLLLVAGCQKKEIVQVKDPGSKNLLDVLRNNFSFSLFYAAVHKAGLEQQLASADSSLTVLVPDNAAFARVGIYGDTAFDRLPAASLKQWIGYHLVKGRTLYDDIPSALDNLYQSINGDILYFSRKIKLQPYETGKKFLHINGDTVINFDITASNGVAHVLNRPLKFPVLSVKAFLDADTAYSLFVMALKKFGLYDQLDKEGPFTVIAPQNTAFTRVGITADSISRLDTARFKKYLFGAGIITPSHLFLSDLHDAPGNQDGPNGVSTYNYTPDGILWLGDYGFIVFGYAYDPRYGPQYPAYGGGFNQPCRIINPDNLALNGVVQRANNLLIYPNNVKINP